MSIGLQLLIGIIVLSVCSLLHIAMLVTLVNELRFVAKRLQQTQPRFFWGVLIVVAFATITFAHLAQVAIWAAVIIGFDADLNWREGIYFALVTYTTLGYGDIVLNEGLRTLGAIAAVTGVLNFGLSTAMLAGLVTRLLPPNGE